MRNSKGQFLAGHPTWNKGLKGYRSGSLNNKWKGGKIEKECLECGKDYQIKIYRKDTAKFCSKLCKNRNNKGISFNSSTQFKPKLSTIETGLPRKVLQKRVRECQSYRHWRTAVYKRDNYTCQICFEWGGQLNADHIKPFATILDEYKVTCVQDAIECNELWSIENGRTLCLECHLKTDTFGSKQRIKKEAIIL